MSGSRPLSGKHLKEATQAAIKGLERVIEGQARWNNSQMARTRLKNYIQNLEKGLICKAVRLSGERCINKITASDRRCIIHTNEVLSTPRHPSILCARHECRNPVAFRTGRKYLKRQEHVAAVEAVCKAEGRSIPDYWIRRRKDRKPFCSLDCARQARKQRTPEQPFCVICKEPVSSKEYVCGTLCGHRLAMKAIASNFTFEVVDGPMKRLKE